MTIAFPGIFTLSKGMCAMIYKLLINPQSRLIDPMRKGATVLPARKAAVVPPTPVLILSDRETTVSIAEPGFVYGGIALTDVAPFIIVELDIEDMSLFGSITSS